MIVARKFTNNRQNPCVVVVVLYGAAASSSTLPPAVVHLVRLSAPHLRHGHAAGVERRLAVRHCHYRLRRHGNVRAARSDAGMAFVRDCLWRFGRTSTRVHQTARHQGLLEGRVLLLRVPAQLCRPIVSERSRRWQQKGLRFQLSASQPDEWPTLISLLRQSGRLVAAQDAGRQSVAGLHGRVLHPHGRVRQVDGQLQAPVVERAVDHSRRPVAQLRRRGTRQRHARGVVHGVGV
jgi:hypothetical protein